MPFVGGAASAPRLSLLLPEKCEVPKHEDPAGLGGLAAATASVAAATAKVAAAATAAKNQDDDNNPPAASTAKTIIEHTHVLHSAACASAAFL